MGMGGQMGGQMGGHMGGHMGGNMGGGYSSYPAPVQSPPMGMSINISAGPNFGVNVGSYGSAPAGFQKVSSSHSRHPPPHAVLGHQNDGAGQVACAIAHTQHGDVPGKAKDGNCWYPYGGKELSTTNFSWIVVPGSRLEQNYGSPPARAIAAGFQHDCGQLYLAIAHTPHGTIPGKAKNGTCWYAYGGQEHVASSFMWVCN